MGYISDSKSYRDYVIEMERLKEDQMEKNKIFTTKIFQAEDYHLVKDKITEAVIMDLASRAQRGLEKYNTTLGENNHQNMLQHAYEEALDMAQYLKKEITELNTIQDLVKQYPNDIELGKAIRAKYGQK
jgi:predicted phage-related endonuclease